MAENNESQSGDQAISLKDPYIAGFLAWLIPGLGHFYQGRHAKGALFLICIFGTFLYGLYLGGSKDVGWGRAVYCSFRPNDMRLPWLCQIGVGLPTVPVTLWQSAQGEKPSFDGFMAPPPLHPFELLDSNGDRTVLPPPGQMPLAAIHRLLPRYFDMATVYTMIAGLLNILAIYDACCGPVPVGRGKNEKEEEKSAGRGPSDKAEADSEEKKTEEKKS